MPLPELVTSRMALWHPKNSRKGLRIDATGCIAIVGGTARQRKSAAGRIKRRLSLPCAVVDNLADARSLRASGERFIWVGALVPESRGTVPLGFEFRFTATLILRSSADFAASVLPHHFRELPEAMKVVADAPKLGQREAISLGTYPGGSIVSF